MRFYECEADVNEASAVFSLFEGIPKDVNEVYLCDECRWLAEEKFKQIEAS